MYEEFATIDTRRLLQLRSKSLLLKYDKISPHFVASLVRQLASNDIVGGQEEMKHAGTILTNPEDVDWIMQVICYGLTFSLTDQDQVEPFRDCAFIYCQWFNALLPSAEQNIPKPIQDEPNLYCQKIIGHKYNIFVQMLDNLKEDNNESVNERIQRQALACHRFLRLIINIASDKDNRMNIETWECLLQFLLAINEELVTAGKTENSGQHIDDRIISTLFQGWLLACVYFFPSPSYWKTFQEICIKLRYREALINQWNRVNVCLAARLSKVIYHLEADKLDLSLAQYAQYNDIICLFDEDTLKQCWYHFLQIIGNPVELCFSEIIFNDNATAVHNNLPLLYHKAIKGMCTLVDIFLGIPNIQLRDFDIEVPRSSMTNLGASETAPEKRRSTYNKNEQASGGKHPVRPQRNSRIFVDTPTQPGQPQLVLPLLQATLMCQNKIKSISLLDVFGKWLFQASMISTPGNFAHNIFEKTLCEAVLFDDGKVDLSCTELKRFEVGQAEAIGALCRIFCSKKQEDDIHLVLSKACHPELQKIKNYLNSFYIALKCGLSSPNEMFRAHLISSIIVNSVGFFESDLPGSKILISSFLNAIEIFLVRKEKSDNMKEIIIRRACIKILISLISFPHHYKGLEIKDTLQETTSNTFISLFPRLVSLFIYGLYNEHDSTNVQLILGAFLFIVEDSVHSDHHFRANILSNGSSDDSVQSLLRFLKGESVYALDESSGGVMTSNLYLLIISFVGEVLCKTSSTNDYTASLTALEILSALGRINHGEQSLCKNKCKLCIKQMFTFIHSQCEKPVTFHSKDMHSTIVAAYQCLAVWIHEHSHLLKDREYVVLLIELIELGISGSKSNKDGQVVNKTDKALRPTSLRVREAAEFVLITLMALLQGNANTPSNESSLFVQDINELRIAQSFDQKGSKLELYQGFRFFANKNSLLVSIYNGALTNEEETVVIIRSPFGKYSWLFRNQHMSWSRLESASNGATLPSSPAAVLYRSLPKTDPNPRHVHFNYFPDFYDNICTSRYDNNVLRLSTYINKQLKEKEDFDTMKNLIDKIETNLRYEKSKLAIATNKKEVGEPPASKTFEPARMILSQFKILHSDGSVTKETQYNDFYSLNISQSFVEQLEKLDMVSTKNNDLVMLFYVPKDFGEEDKMFEANRRQYRSNRVYQQFLHSLGQSVECGEAMKLFHWFDVSHEFLFVCPMLENRRQETIQDKLSLANLIEDDNETIRSKMFNMFNETERARYNLLNNNGCDLKLFVLWIESMDDFDSLPFKSFFQVANGKSEISDKIHLITITPLKNGLFRVITQALSLKTSITPIIEQMLLSKHLLAPFIRLTALNLFRRRRMNTEFQVAYVKRRNKIQELVAKHKHDESRIESMLLGN